MSTQVKCLKATLEYKISIKQRVESRVHVLWNGVNTILKYTIYVCTDK